MPHGAEAVTRHERIDPKLRQAGWDPIVPSADGMRPDGLRSTAVTEWETQNGPADYALCDDNRIQAVVEAKKLTVGPEGVLPQAERYYRGADQTPKYQGEFGVPFLYSTNGEVIRFHDIRDPLNHSRKVKGFHTPPSFRELPARHRQADLAKALRADLDNVTCFTHKE